MTEDGGLGTHLRLYQLGQTVVNAYPALGVALEGCLDPPPGPLPWGTPCGYWCYYPHTSGC